MQESRIGEPKSSEIEYRETIILINRKMLEISLSTYTYISIYLFVVLLQFFGNVTIRSAFAQMSSIYFMVFSFYISLRCLIMAFKKGEQLTRV